MLNKCTFTNPNFPWTSRMKTELQYEQSAAAKLYMTIWERVNAHHSSCTVHTTVTSIFVEWSYSNFLTTLIPRPFPDLSWIPWHFQVCRNSRKVVSNPVRFLEKNSSIKFTTTLCQTRNQQGSILYTATRCHSNSRMCKGLSSKGGHRKTCFSVRVDAHY